jgi:hypothetical protein
MIKKTYDLPSPRFAAALIVFTAAFAINATGAAAAEPSAAVAPFTVKLSEGTAKFPLHLALQARSFYRSRSNVPTPAGPPRGHVPALGANAVAPPFYPVDVKNYNDAAVLKTAISHNLYVNCPASCWGDPEGSRESWRECVYSWCRPVCRGNRRKSLYGRRIGSGGLDDPPRQNRRERNSRHCR